MKKYILFILISFMALQSCDLDINDNPNDATGTSVTADFVLPAALASTASNIVRYNAYGSFIVGYHLPGAGLSGFSSDYTYTFTSTDNVALWDSVHSNLRDYQFVINQAESKPKYALYAAVARIQKVFNYELLVDAYGDVPWTNGLKGSADLSPKFDDDAATYQLLVKELDDAIAVITTNASKADGSVLALTEVADPLFNGDLTKWKQFANNIKLRLLVRASGTSIDSFVQSAFATFSTDGFLKEDALINPGYNTSSKQNPSWTTLHSSIAEEPTQIAQYYIPSKYVLTYYNGTVLQDSIRGQLLYKGYPGTTVGGQLADETNNPTSPRYAWTGKSDGTGVFKDRTQGQPVFLASEVYFLLAEAALKGHILDGGAKPNFEKGILASFTYLRQKANKTYDSGVNPATDLATYLADNSGKYLVDYSAATTDAQHLEAIITQKYIALNYIHGHEAWNEFRRTTYPKISGTAATTTFVSLRSQSTRADKLPVRKIYPQSEYNLNANVPTLQNAFSNPIFWDLN
jgi:hypothetical protein